MKKTEIYELNMPEQEDFYNVEHFNENAKKTEEALLDAKKHADELLEEYIESNPYKYLNFANLNVSDLNTIKNPNQLSAFSFTGNAANAPFSDSGYGIQLGRYGQIVVHPYTGKIKFRGGRNGLYNSVWENVIDDRSLHLKMYKPLFFNIKALVGWKRLYTFKGTGEGAEAKARFSKGFYTQLTLERNWNSNPSELHVIDILCTYHTKELRLNSQLINTQNITQVRLVYDSSTLETHIDIYYNASTGNDFRAWLSNPKVYNTESNSYYTNLEGYEWMMHPDKNSDGRVAPALNGTSTVVASLDLVSTSDVHTRVSNLEKGVDYSSKVVGKWIDGRTVYRAIISKASIYTEGPGLGYFIGSVQENGDVTNAETIKMDFAAKSSKSGRNIHLNDVFPEDDIWLEYSGNTISAYVAMPDVEHIYKNINITIEYLL